MNVVPASAVASLTELYAGGWNPSPPIVEEVARILADVAARGDAAVVEYTRRFDDGGFDLTRLRRPIPTAAQSRSQIPSDVAQALEVAKERVARFHERQRQPDIAYVEEDGTRYALARRPLRSVAVYAPRASAAVAILMGVVPAKIAGVARTIVLSPAPAGSQNVAALFAAALCGADEFYAVGGAQAVAAAAFGTPSLAAVDKIVGRGGLWTTEAKRQLAGRCGTDALSGPVEVLVVADDGASSEFVVGELLAQAECPDVTRLAVISESRPLLEAVAQLIDTLDLATLDGMRGAGEAIATHCKLIEATTREELFEVVNRFAPAYLCLQVRDATAYLERVHAAGTVFVGDMTPLVSGEYLAGISRVAPTAGTARFASSLSLADFTKTFSVVENSVERAANDAALLAALAEFDDLPHHAETARMRFGN